MKHVFYIFLFLIIFLSSSISAMDTIFLEGFGERITMRMIQRGEIDYLSASDFFSAIKATSNWDFSRRQLNVEISGHNFLFELFNPYCKADQTIRNLTHEPHYHIDDLYLPINSLCNLLDQTLEQSFSYDQPRQTIVTSTSGSNVATINVTEKINGVLVEIMLTKKMEYEVFVTEGNWINITIIGAQIDTRKLNGLRPSKLVRKIKSFQFENSAQISIRFKGKIADYHHNYASLPHRIQISVENKDFSAEDYDSGFSVGLDEYDPIDIIVIDAGHGGEHNGAIGKNGLMEKDIVLDISLRVEELLDRDTNFTSILTRRSDRTVDLEQRASIANKSAGDLYVSIHANSSTKKKASGCETFFLAVAKSDDARAAEMLENSDFETEYLGDINYSDNDLDFIVMDLLQTEYLQQSKQLAEIIQSELKEKLNIRSRGINQAGFVVLNKVLMPSVLVEVAFISNKMEEKLLAREEFRQSAAEAIYNGIIEFSKNYNRESVDAESN